MKLRIFSLFLLSFLMLGSNGLLADSRVPPPVTSKQAYQVLLVVQDLLQDSPEFLESAVGLCYSKNGQMVLNAGYNSDPTEPCVHMLYKEGSVHSLSALDWLLLGKKSVRARGVWVTFETKLPPGVEPGVSVHN